LKTESRYKNKLTTESCFHLHKILDSTKKELFEIYNTATGISIITMTVAMS